jgi:hypothetical protein
MVSRELDDSELLRRAREHVRASGTCSRRHARAVPRSLPGDCDGAEHDATAPALARALQPVVTGLGGGCLAVAAPTPSRPLDPATDRLAHGVRVYGLAADDVIGVTVRAHGPTRRATISHDTFSLQVVSSAVTRRFTLTLLGHLRDGKTRRMSIPVADGGHPTRETLPVLPGALAPVEDTAA